jgi:hypothetical protein
MFTLGPYTLAPGLATTPKVETPADSSQPITGVSIENLSGLLCQVQWAGTTRWLLPWSGVWLAAKGNNTPTLEVDALTDIQPTGGDPLKLFVTVWQNGDGRPDVLTWSLTAEALVAALTEGSTVGIVGNVPVVNPADQFLLNADIPAIQVALTATATASLPNSIYRVTYQTAAVPIGYTGLVINLNEGALVSVVGIQSGIQYAYRAPGGSVVPVVIDIDPGADSTYNIQVTSTSTTPVMSPVYAFPDPPQFPAPVTEAFCFSSVNATGSATVDLINTVNGLLVTLKEVWWTISAASGTAPIYHIQVTDIYGNNYEIGTAATTGPGSNSGLMSFPDGGLSCSTAGLQLTYAGHSTGTASELISVGCSYVLS